MRLHEGKYCEALAEQGAFEASERNLAKILNAHSSVKR
jgi:hypothetical protein